MDRGLLSNESRRDFAKNFPWFLLAVGQMACTSNRNVRSTEITVPVATETLKDLRDEDEIKLWKLEKVNTPIKLDEILRKMEMSHDEEIKKAGRKISDPTMCKVNVMKESMPDNRTLSVHVEGSEGGNVMPVVEIYPMRNFEVTDVWMAAELVRASTQIAQIREVIRVSGMGTDKIENMFKTLAEHDFEYAAEAYGNELATTTKLQRMGVNMTKKMPGWAKKLQKAYFQSDFEKDGENYKLNTKSSSWVQAISELNPEWRSLK